MTPAERDEVRRIAAETIDAHTLRHNAAHAIHAAADAAEES